MPQQQQSAVSEPAGQAVSYGQVIEYIQDRLYLASYTHPPNAHTPFPYPSKPARSPLKRSSRAGHGPTPASSTGPRHPPVYFSIDKNLLYNAFHADFGPLHVGHLYRFAVQLHEVLGDPDNEDRGVVFWSHADSRSRANAACILACYMVLIQNWPPHLALAPIAQMDPPCMPFRDAGYSQADYTLTVQDVVYGLWKAKEERLIELKEFSLEDYEKYERVDMGDFNWITPSFVAFASPQHSPVNVIPASSAAYAKLPSSIREVQKSELPEPFKNVLSHFHERDVGLVVRLNSELYSPSYFTALGIKHLDMIFDDGTCPPLNLVRKFVNLAHDTINIKHKGIAVHCKAGLGRTGCLIGAYLIYRYGFTANEIIAFMRFMRPGMVVGPQQHWLHLNQGTFREWWFEDGVRDKFALLQQQQQQQQPSTPTRASNQGKKRLESNSQTFTPPQHGSQKRAALGEITANEAPHTRESSVAAAADSQLDHLPAPTPGQPRKTSRVYGKRSPSHHAVGGVENEPDTEIVQMQSKVAHAPDASDTDDSREEWQQRLLSAAKRGSLLSSTSSSPGSKRRAVSCTTTTTTTTMRKWDVGSDSEDVENNEKRNGTLKPRTPGTAVGKSGSGSGAGNLSVGKRRESPTRSGVRKTSGRVGSVGVVNQAARVKQ
ncbi:MAG: cell division control protein 14 [Bathelium mastoideum]|nr:MAG: cell division control protein 14 [Bathelium mastoideum]